MSWQYWDSILGLLNVSSTCSPQADLQILNSFVKLNAGIIFRNFSVKQGITFGYFKQVRIGVQHSLDSTWDTCTPYLNAWVSTLAPLPISDSCFTCILVSTRWRLKFSLSLSLFPIFFFFLLFLLTLLLLFLPSKIKILQIQIF